MKTSFIKHLLLTAVLLVGFTVGFAQKKQEQKTIGITKEDITSIHSESDGTRINESRIKFEKEGKSYFMKLVDDQVTELTIDGKKIAPDNMHLYAELIDAVKKQLAAARAQAEEDRKQAALDRIQAEKDRAQAEKDRQLAQQERDRAEKDRERLKIERQQADRDRQQAMNDRAQAERDRQQAVKDRAQAEVDRKHAEEDRALIRSLLEMAVKEGLVANEDTRLELSAEGFWINDKKQTDAIHNKYKASFLKKTGSRISFSRNYTGIQQSVINLKK
jgi:hypothetical protein